MLWKRGCSIVTVLVLTLVGLRAFAQGNEGFLDKPFSVIDTGLAQPISFSDRLFRTPVASFTDGGLRFDVNPLLDQKVGNDGWWRNGRGLYLAAYSKKIWIETYYLEMQEVNIPTSLRQHYQNTGAIPNYSRHKRFKETGFDVNNVFATVAFSLAPDWDVKTGFGRIQPQRNTRDLVYGRHFASYPFLQSQLKLRPWGLYLDNRWFRYTTLNRLPATASAESQLIHIRQNASSLRWQINSVSHVTLGHVHYTNSLDSISNTATRVSWQGLSPVPWVALLADPTESVWHFRYQLGVEKWPVRLHGQILGGQESTVAQALQGISWGVQREDVSLRLDASYLLVNEHLPAFTHLEQEAAWSQLFGNQWLFTAEARYKRLYMDALVMQAEGYGYAENPTESVLRYYILAGFLVNPSYNLRLGLGYRNGMTSGANEIVYFSATTDIQWRYLDF